MASTQFRSDDTTAWWLKYGDGSDGAYSSSGNATDAPVDSSCSGTVDTTSLSATNASFANGEPILIHQSRGTGAGNWELNQIASYVAGTITTVSPLKNTYTDSGASQAQVIQLKQYSSFTQNSGHILTAKAWNGNVGGIIAFLCNGITTITGNLVGSNKGFVGGQSVSSGDGYAGEGTTGASTIQKTANGNGGGGGEAGGHGGGGGNALAGSPGATTGQEGAGGNQVGTASLVNMNLGGGGGSGAGFSTGQGTGGIGGGIVIIITKTLAEITGAISLSGQAGTGGPNRASGGGAGGSCLLKAQTATLGTTKITASAGAGGTSPGGNGGTGSVGRIHLDYLTSYTGTTTPTLDVTQDASLTSGGVGALFFAQY
jgi:hypothetical protein